MGQSQDVLKCDRCCDANVPVLATVVQSKQALSNNDALANHDLLRYARAGHTAGVSEALSRGAWTETRKPWLVRPQESESNVSSLASSSTKAHKNEGMTPLMYSSQNGNLEVVTRLIQAGASINAVEEDGWTPLHFAAKEQNSAICQKLLESRAFHQIKNCDGQTPLTLSKTVDDTFVAEYQRLVGKFGFNAKDVPVSKSKAETGTLPPIKAVIAESGANEGSTVAEEPSSGCKSEELVSPESTTLHQCVTAEDSGEVCKNSASAGPKSPRAGGC